MPIQSMGQMHGASTPCLLEEVMVLAFGKLSLGDGKRIRFWEDKWCEGIPLSEAFLALYYYVGSKGALIADL